MKNNCETCRKKGEGRIRLNKRMKITIKKKIGIAILGLAVMMSGCQTTEKVDTKSAVFTIEKDGKTVDAVSEQYAWLYTLMYKDQYEAFFGEEFWEEQSEDGTTYAELFKEDLIDEMKSVKMFNLEAEANGVSLDKEEKEICASNAEQYLESIEEDTLKKTGITAQTLAEYEEDYTLYDKYRTELLKNEKIEINEEEVKQSDFFILNFETVDYDDDGEEIVYSAKKKAAQKKKAEEAYKMLQSGKDIETVAEKYGFDPDICQLTTGKTPEKDRDEYYDEAFENAAFSLKEGEYSKVTECMDGYYIIKMLAEENEDETAAAMESAQQEMEEELFAPMLEEIESKYEITMNEENWDKISFTEKIGYKEEEVSEEESEEIEIDEGSDEETEE